MTYHSAQRRLPRFLLRWIYHFETTLDAAVARFAQSLPAGAIVLDAGAGEARHAPLFHRQRYTPVDLAIGDDTWNYARLHTLADLARLPFASSSFDAAINIVTLEHLPDPRAALAEIARALKPGAPLLIVAPHQWEVHQAPHDYYRYTRYGLRHLLEQAGFDKIHVYPVGGLFRLLQRRLLAAALIFPWPWKALSMALLVPPALLLPVFDTLDKTCDYTPGYIASASLPNSPSSRLHPPSPANPPTT